MTPQGMAQIHALCFQTPPPWRAEAIAALLESPFCFALTESDGFLIGRVVADEAEVLTVSVLPTARGKGQGGRLVQGFLAQARARGAATAFLEVAADNAPAISLYLKAGFGESGLRRGYYVAQNGRRIDALMLSRGLQ